MSIYSTAMSTKNTPHDILDQIAAIDRMERGKLSVIRQGPSGSYFNLQRREGGRNMTEYVPADQVARAQENIDAHTRFQSLVGEYVDLIATQSRLERKAGAKKKRPAQTSASPKKRKSKT